MDFKQVPNITFNSRMNEHAQIEEEAQLDLATLAQQLKKGQKMFKTKQEQVDSMIED